MIGVEDLRPSILSDRLLNRFEAEVRGQRIGEPSCQHPTTRPVQDGKQVHEVPAYRKIGDISCPDLVGMRDRHVAQERGIDLVGGMPLSGAGLAVHGAVMPMRRIRVARCRRPITWPSCRRRSRSIRTPAKGYGTCSSSIRRIRASTDAEMGVGR